MVRRERSLESAYDGGVGGNGSKGSQGEDDGAGDGESHVERVCL